MKDTWKGRGRNSPRSSLHLALVGASLHVYENAQRWGRQQWAQLALEKSAAWSSEKCHDLGHPLVGTRGLAAPGFPVLTCKFAHAPAANRLRKGSPHKGKVGKRYGRRICTREKANTIFHSFSIHEEPTLCRVRLEGPTLDQQRPSLTKLRMRKWHRASNSKGAEKSRDLVWEMGKLPWGCPV